MYKKPDIISMTPEKKREYDRLWRKTHPEHIKRYEQKNKSKRKEWVRRWRAKNKQRNKEINANAYLKHTYGITLDDYNRMLDSQNGVCAICGKSPSEYKRKLHVDHDHSTGKNRGLLCVRCNYGLGYFEEDMVILENAKKYISHFAPGSQ